MGICDHHPGHIFELTFRLQRISRSKKSIPEEAIIHPDQVDQRKHKMGCEGSGKTYRMTAGEAGIIYSANKGMRLNVAC